MGNCINTKRSEQVLEAVDAYFGDTQCRVITIEDIGENVSGSLIILNTKQLNIIEQEYEEKSYTVFVDDGTEVAPTADNLITVTVDPTDTAIVVAETIKTDIEAYFVAQDEFQPICIEVEGAKVHIENKFIGSVETEVSTLVGISISVERLGFGRGLGAFADGGVALATETEVLDVTSDQTGTTKLDQILRGSNLSASMSLAEMSDERIEDLVGKVRGDILEVMGDKLVGYGTSKLNKSLLNFAGKLILHPIRLPLEDRSRDFIIWKTAPNMNSLNFSGANIQVGEFEFNSYQDKARDSKIDIGMKGDWTKAL